MLPGKIAFLLIVATALSVIGALVVANRYRAAMQRLMKIGQETASTATAAIPAPGLPAAADLPPVTVSLDDNRRAERRHGNGGRWPDLVHRTERDRWHAAHLPRVRRRWTVRHVGAHDPLGVAVPGAGSAARAR